MKLEMDRMSEERLHERTVCRACIFGFRGNAAPDGRAHAHFTFPLLFSQILFMPGLPDARASAPSSLSLLRGLANVLRTWTSSSCCCEALNISWLVSPTTAQEAERMQKEMQTLRDESLRLARPVNVLRAHAHLDLILSMLPDSQIARFTQYCLLQEAERMQKEMQTLRDENLRLAGHTNASQKIRYLQTVKQEYNELNKV